MAHRTRIAAIAAATAALTAAVGGAHAGVSYAAVDTTGPPTTSGAEPASTEAVELSDETREALYQVIIPVSATYTEANLAGARSEAERLGLANVEEVSSEGDPASMVAQIDDAITKDASAIILNPINSEAADPAVQRAIDAGICVVIAYSNIFDTPQSEVAPGTKAFIGWDERQAGAAMAQAIAERLGGEGGIAVDGGIPANLGQQIRWESARDEWEANYPDIEILDVQYSESDPAKARTIAQNFIQSFGDDIDAMVFIDDNTGAAGVQVIEDSSIAGNVVVGAYGGNGEFVQMIRDGRAYATIPFTPFSDYEAAMRLAAECVNGDTTPVLALTPTLPILAPFEATGYVITSDNADQFEPQW
jgi:inositol transport system substrate-binding protein